MRFALHLLAALLLIEEYAGCHEDGTADDERLADESRAVTGLGEAAVLGGIRAGEVLSLGHCAVPFLFRALSDWASERFPIEIIMRLNWDCCI